MEGELDLRRYFLLLRRWLWLVVGCAVLAAASAYVVSRQMDPVYSASATLLVRQAPTSGLSDYSAVLMSDRLARTYVQMLTEEPVMEAAIASLGLEGVLTPGGLAGKVKVELVSDTQLIRLRVEDTDAARAALLADAVADAFIAQNLVLQQARYADSLGSVRAQMEDLSRLMEETQTAIDALGTPETPVEQAELGRLETILAGYRNTYASFLQSYEQMRLTAAQSADDVVVFRRAKPGGQVRPNVMQNTLLAGAVGAMLAVGVAFLVEYLDDTIKTPEDVTRALGLGTLGAIGRLRKGDSELVVIDQPLSHVSESFRILRTNIRFTSVDNPLHTLLVTSAGPSEGKSVTVANLAAAMAQSGLRVITVDGDLRRPRLHRLFGVHPQEGLTGSLLEGTMDGRLQATQLEGLAVLPAGELPPNPAELLGSRRMKELLELLARHVDVVLVDSPPVLPLADAVTLAQVVDGVLLVVDAGETRREAAHRAVESLRQVGANVIGAVINAVPERGGRYYYHYYYYQRSGYQRYAENGGKRRRRRVKEPALASQVSSETNRG